MNAAVDGSNVSEVGQNVGFTTNTGLDGGDSVKAGEHEFARSTALGIFPDPMVLSAEGDGALPKLVFTGNISRDGGVVAAFSAGALSKFGCIGDILALDRPLVTNVANGRPRTFLSMVAQRGGPGPSGCLPVHVSGLSRLCRARTLTKAPEGVWEVYGFMDPLDLVLHVSL